MQIANAYRIGPAFGDTRNPNTACLSADCQVPVMRGANRSAEGFDASHIRPRITAIVQQFVSGPKVRLVS